MLNVNSSFAAADSNFKPDLNLNNGIMNFDTNNSQNISYNNSSKLNNSISGSSFLVSHSAIPSDKKKHVNNKKVCLICYFMFLVEVCSNFSCVNI